MLNSSLNPTPDRNPPNSSFEHLGLRKETVRLIPRAWESPLPIQENAIPVIVKGRDVIGLAETGSGKTGAFAIPIVDHLMEHPGNSVRAVVLNPVRELAKQTFEVFQELTTHTGIRSSLLRGGKPVKGDIRELRNTRPHIVVGSLGRLADLVGKGELNLSRVDTFVIDEADRMSQEFDSQPFQLLLRAMPKSRQTLLFSATMPKSVENSLSKVTLAPVKIDLGANKPPVAINFEEYDVSGHPDKISLLTTLMKERGFDQALVFMSRKIEIDAVEELLVKLGYDAWGLHHDRNQTYCEDTLDRFKRGEIKILLASDALQRGIDITGLPLVLNYDFPRSFEDFTHRAGRTGRQGHPGLVISFVTYRDRIALQQATGHYKDYRRNLEFSCLIDHPKLPPLASVLTPAEIALMEETHREAWGKRS